MKELRIVIVEDEPVTARNLAHMLQIIDDTITISATHAGVEDAVDWFKVNTNYDLVFMDIKLSDGLSFDIFKQVEVQAPVIFVTAYNDYGITAFKNNGIDYILKPFESAEVEQALNKFKKLTSSATQNTIDTLQLAQLLEQISGQGRAYKKSFLVHYRDKLIPVDSASIAFFYTANEIVYAYTADNKTYVMDFTIDALMKQLDPDNFFKANRQFIINRKAIIEVEFFFNSRLSIKIKPEPPEKILISKARVPEFKGWMSN